MQGKWEELLSVLDRMLNIYQTILTLNQQKKQILVAANAQELEKVTKQEGILLLQVTKLEQLRGKLVTELMASHGIAGKQLSLEQLCKIAPPSIVEKLETFGEKLKNIMTELAPLNKLNTKLIKQALGFINYNINLLSQTVVDSTYASKGQTNQQRMRAVFDAKV